ncbi:intradiol ring-cleavage dioxygenase [Notoacmeibacter sp. MSK16QG-6]|uniref:intradiol ring-cleavage dioxygenase n=1 Tax=Notoacmeibacter sp. MSK16QG-6 TaxID=2957982 RepID=UPI00273A63C0|nr:intradiol ring-cleavage dioxygenase [Notoacmeibacter sp. MSK16QG-6]
MDKSENSPSNLSRRDALRLVAITAGGAVAGSSLTTAAAAAENGSAVSLLEGASVCQLTPEVTEGPFYVDPELVRSDITEDQHGVPLDLKMQVVDATCKPIANARVDVWHASAEGIYSGISGGGQSVDTSGQTFCRGTQMADENGIVHFTTVYPGWYRGRTTHIHFKVYLDEANVLTGQIFFPDALSQFIYDNVAPYDQRDTERDTYNSADSIAQQATRASHALLKEMDESYLALLVVGVDPNAESSDPGMSGQPGGPPPGANGERPAGPPPGGDGQPGAGGQSEPVEKSTIVPGAGN